MPSFASNLMRLKIVFLDLLIKHISSLTCSSCENILFITTHNSEKTLCMGSGKQCELDLELEFFCHLLSFSNSVAESLLQTNFEMVGRPLLE